MMSGVKCVMKVEIVFEYNFEECSILFFLHLVFCFFFFFIRGKKEKGGKGQREDICKVGKPGRKPLWMRPPTSTSRPRGPGQPSVKHSR